MDRYMGGDEAAFGDLYQALAPPLRRYFVRQTRSGTRAADLLQQTMLQLHLTRDRFVRGSDVVPWACAIGRRVLINDVRCARRGVARVTTAADHDLDPPAFDAPADERLHRARSVQAVVCALARLPEPQRMAFQLVNVDGLSMREAAELLGTSVNAVKLRARRACLALRAAARAGESSSPGASGPPRVLRAHPVAVPVMQPS